MTLISWRYQVVHVPYHEHDPQHVLQERLCELPLSYRLISVTDDGAWTLVVEDAEAS